MAKSTKQKMQEAAKRAQKKLESYKSEAEQKRRLAAALRGK
jgi:hypothetical protein